MARLPLLLALPFLSACATAPAQDVSRASGPPEAVAGICHAKAIAPAVPQTVTGQAMQGPAMTAPDGTALRPARTHSTTETRIVAPPQTTRFLIPCALQRREPDFIMQIQRALQVRDLYAGPISGTYDAETRAAVAAYQPWRESEELSTEAAQRLGLVVLGRDG